jgi:hypothetical protein
MAAAAAQAVALRLRVDAPANAGVTVAANCVYRAPALLQTSASHYTFEALQAGGAVEHDMELKQEHRAACHTETIKPKFVCLKVDAKVTIGRIYSHFQIKKKFKDLILDLGLDCALQFVLVLMENLILGMLSRPRMQMLFVPLMDLKSLKWKRSFACTICLISSILLFASCKNRLRITVFH